MKVIGLNGQTYSWVMKQAQISDEHRSGPHKRARALLQTLYPGTPLYEEVPLPGTRLHFDLVLPSRRLIVEVNGRQHYVRAKARQTKLEFLQARKNDGRKAEFCELNHLHLVVLTDVGTDDDWIRLLTA
jgi:hypothetical protein